YADAMKYWTDFAYMFSWNVIKHPLVSFTLIFGFAISFVLFAMEIYQQHNNPNAEGVKFSGITTKLDKRYVLNSGFIIDWIVLALDQLYCVVGPIIMAQSAKAQTDRAKDVPFYHVIDFVMFATAGSGHIAALHYWGTNRQSVLIGICLLGSAVAVELFLFWLRTRRVWKTFC